MGMWLLSHAGIKIKIVLVMGAAGAAAAMVSQVRVKRVISSMCNFSIGNDAIHTFVFPRNDSLTLTVRGPS